jgi:hypothetical protein
MLDPKTILSLSKVELFKICQNLETIEVLRLRETCKKICHIISGFDLYWFEKYLNFQMKCKDADEKFRDDIYEKGHTSPLKKSCLFSNFIAIKKDFFEQYKASKLFVKEQEDAEIPRYTYYTEYGKREAIHKHFQYLLSNTEEFDIGNYCLRPYCFTYKLKPMDKVSKILNFNERKGRPIYWYLIEVYREKRKNIDESVEQSLIRVRSLRNRIGRIKSEYEKLESYELKLKEYVENYNECVKIKHNKVFYNKRAKTYKPPFKI